MGVAKITIESADKVLEIARADVSIKPARQIGPIVQMPAGSTMVFNVNEVQGLVIREKP
jgi:hypothetical protein